MLTHLHDEMLAGRDQARAASKALFATRPGKLRKRLRRALRGSSTPAIDDGAGTAAAPATDPSSP
jgi:hypothetical protein